jgi:CheY-like chemotaxis protein
MRRYGLADRKELPSPHARVPLTTCDAAETDVRRVMNRKALVADTRPENLESARIGLGYAGYHVITTARLDEALEMARMEGIDLILLGVPLPPEDEVSCGIARTIRSDPVLSSVPIVFLIGSAAARPWFPSCLDLPATSFVATPFNPMELAVLVREGLIGQRR